MRPHVFTGRFFQLGYGVRDIDGAIAQLRRRMGATLIDRIPELRDEMGKLVVIQSLSHMVVPGAEIELIQPRLDQPSIYLDALLDHSEDITFHHMAFLVPDTETWGRAVASFETEGTPIVMKGETSWVRFAYFDTRRQCGHYSELLTIR